MNENVRGAGRSTVPALIAGVGHPDFPGRQFVGETKKPPVGTSVGTKTLLPQEIHGQEPADEEKRNRDGNRRKSFPKITRDKMVGEFRDKWSG